jgi:Outer membrane lipoprotein-sorting protein
MIRRLAFGAALAVLVIGAEVFADDTLAALLRAVGDASQPSNPLRAEGTIDSDGLRGKTQDRLVWIERAGSGAGAPLQVYVELANAKVRLLALGPADLRMAIDGRPSQAKPDQAVDSTSFTAEDALTFAPDRCAAMRLAELSGDRFSIVCEPKKPPSQYSLMVYKFDREKAAMLQVLLYKGTMTNLVKMLRNDDFVQVGAKWRPQRVTMQDFKVRTKDVLSLRWQAAVNVPAETFDPRQLTGASLLVDSSR